MTITPTQLEGILGQDVYASDGDRVGKVGQIFLDDITGNPEWLTVQTGLFGTKESFVPLASADLHSDRIRVQFDKDTIKGAPQVNVDDGHLPEGEEAELYKYYGIDYGIDGSDGQQLERGLPSDEQGFGLGVTSGTQDDAGFADVEGRTRGLDSSRRDDEDRRAGRQSADFDTDDAMTRSEEQLHVGTETVDGGKARLRKYVVTEQQTVTVPVSREEVRIEREPVTEANLDASMDGPTITEAEHEVVLTKEQVVVNKEAVPVERVRLSKDTVTEDREVTEDVRKEQIESSIEGIDDPVTGTTGRDGAQKPSRS